MRRTLAAIAGATCAVLTVMLVGAGSAMAGEFAVAACQSDKLNNATSAFETSFLTRGMRVRRACNPAGPGERGLITANVERRGVVRKGAASILTITPPPGTVITWFRWRGDMHHDDCRFGLYVYADLLGGANHVIRSERPSARERATDRCYRRNRQPFDLAAVTKPKRYYVSDFRTRGATRILQRVICQAQKACSSSGKNFIRTLEADLRIADVQAPAVTVSPDTPLAAGAWVSGDQPLRYDAHDNVGVRKASVYVESREGGIDDRPCRMATLEGAYSDAVPCPSGPGQITANTVRLGEGTRPLVVQAQDAAGNVGGSAPVMARIDNTAPPQVPVSVEGGDQWRNRNDFALAWANPAEDDRAPIVAATYKLCPSPGDNCTQAERAEAGIARLPVQVPGPGEWRATMWRRDEAGNQDGRAASVPVTLRYDPDAPRLGFEPAAAADPTAVAVQVTDGLSGLAGGSIEIARAGSNTWQALDTQKVGSRLVARVDDAALPAGDYVLRSTARDHAGNQASTTARLDGQQMALTLPLRIASAMQVGVVGKRTVRRVVRVDGRRRTVRRRVTVLKPAAGVVFGGRAQVTGRLANGDGQGIPDAELQVLSRSDATLEHLVGTVRTDAAGNFAYTAVGSTSRVLRFAYGGSPLVLPAQGEVRLRVPATSTLRPSRTRLTNGQSVAFVGRVRTLPVPVGGKLVELQVLLSGRWQTFRTGRTDQAGVWRLSYRFARTRTVQRFRFRAKLPREAGYPFASGGSRSVEVVVRGG